MTQRISGPGQGNPFPQYLYPTELYGAPYDAATNRFTLSPGDTLPVPAGDFLIGIGEVSTLQWIDPVTNIWRGLDGFRGQSIQIFSTGFNYRIANLTGCPVAAVVTGQGSGYPTTGTTVTSTGAGGSTWAAVVGGQVTVSTVSFAGSGYGITPEVFIPAPPAGGVQATAYATISAGTVSGVTMTNFGGGYPSIPTGLILPSSMDPNIGVNTISQATVTFALTGAGKIAAVLCTNPGAPVATAPTLTVSGTGGSGATVSAVLLQTVTSASISAAGAGYGTVAEVTTVGGTPTAGVGTNPAIEGSGYRPRKASIGVTLTGTSLTAIGTIYDSGLFMVGNAPGVIVNGNSIVTTAATVLLTLGGANDTVTIQSL